MYSRMETKFRIHILIKDDRMEIVFRNEINIIEKVMLRRIFKNSI